VKEKFSHTLRQTEIPPSDRAEIVDALYRFGAGQDLDDRRLLESAFAENATLDFVEPAKRLGATIEVFRGRTRIVEAVMSATSQLDTTHTVTNPRITEFDGDRAAMWALVEAQHLPTDDHSRHLLLKNFYSMKLVREGGRWVIERMDIENVWMTGEASVLFPQGVV
jgi:hypothetical protein